MVRLIRRAAGSLALSLVAVFGLSALAIAAAVMLFSLTPTGAVALYFVVWWTSLFAVLPFGVRSQAEEGDIAAGTDPGAPGTPALAEKAIWTTFLAAAVFLVAAALLPLTGL